MDRRSPPRTVAVAIPVHPARVANGMLARAVASVHAQTRPPDQLAVALDTTGAGSAATRNQALAEVTTEWVAFLDSDDELDPRHLECLLKVAERDSADLVYPWFRKVGAADIWAIHEGRTFDPAVLRRGNFIAITVLVRAEAIRAVGGFRRDRLRGGEQSAADEWNTWLRLLDAGATFAHARARTWTWHCHGANTQGLPTRGDARTMAPTG